MLLALEAVHRGHVFKFKLLNTDFITLLPKKADALKVKDYQPISLIHSFAKLVSKIMANWFAPFLKQLASINQAVFVQGRSIENIFLFVRQMARCPTGKKMPHILLKLDISKAFDSVSWSFLLEILQKLGFGQKWCNLICLLLSTSSTGFLVNPEPAISLLHHHGLWQGDPLSPIVFILVMEVLDSLVGYATRNGFLQYVDL